MRLSADPRISCSTEIYPFYLPGAAVLILTAVIGIPVLFYRLIKISTQYIDVIPIDGTTDDNVKWIRQILLTRNAVKSMYADFSKKWRYYRLIIMIQKFMIVALFVFTPDPKFLIVAVGLIQFVFFLVMLASRPYIYWTENLLANICMGLVAADAIICACLGWSINIPQEFFYVLIAFNVIAPIVVAIVALSLQHSISNQLIQEHKTETSSIHASISIKGTAVIAQPNTFDSISNSPNIPNPITPSPSTPPGLNSLQSTMFPDDPELPPEVREVEAFNFFGHNEPVAPPPEAPSHPLDAKQLKHFVRRLDNQLNRRLLRILVNFFFVFGIAAYIALAVTSTGVIINANAPQIVTDPGTTKVNKSRYIYIF